MKIINIKNYKKKNLRAMLAPICTNQRRIGSITIQDPMFITEEGHSARCELDTHADTCVAGANFLIHSFDGQTCDVMPYTDTYDAVRDVPVVTASTAWTNEVTGETFILYFPQVLWYGKKMKVSLINPNQLRHFGLQVCDDMTDKNRSFGIEIDDNIVIPFKMDGTIIHFTTRVPTQWEMENCRLYMMTDDSPWDPATVQIYAISQKQTDHENVQISEIRKLACIATTNQSMLEDSILRSVSEVYDSQTFLRRMVGAVNIATSSQRTERDGTCMSCKPHVTTHTVSFIGTKDRHAHVTAEEVARKFRCGIETAKKTLQTTTQRGVRQARHPLHRRYRVDHLHLNRKRLNDTFYTDTLFSRVKSLQGHKCAQIYTNGKFTRVYPMESKSSANIAATLQDFADDVGIPDTLICDLATEQVGAHTPMMKEIRRLRIRLRNSEKGRSNQNHKAETEIREVKKKWKLRMREKNVPRRLWDFGLVYIAEITSIIARGTNGRPGMEEILGQTVDISEWLDFDFYDQVWYWDEKKTDMNKEQRKLGRWLGIAHRVGSEMTYWILTKAAKVIARSTVQHVTITDMEQDAIKTAVTEFNTALSLRLSDENYTINDPGIFYIDDEEPVDDDDETMIPDDAEYGDMLQAPKPEVDDIDMYDKYLNSEFVVDRGGEQVRAKVLKRAKSESGYPIGTAHTNPIFDTRVYECVTEDGTTERYTANIIAENIYAQCDDEGKSYAVLDEIIDHSKDGSAIEIADGFITSANGNRIPKKTTRGWKLLCSWKDGTSDWIALKDLKDSNPIEVAEYAVANKINEEPAFKWWVSDILRRRNRIISKVKSRYWKLTHKFGIRLPHSVQEALRIDEATGTKFWSDAIKKELTKVNVAFEFCENWSPEQVRKGHARGDFVGYQEIKCHIIFDIKMDLTRKARMVAGGHMTETPTSLTYSSVVSRDSVRVAFLYAALNDLDVMSCDVSNAYLNAPCREKIWFVAGPEFGSRQGQVVKVVRALYGLKSSGAAWRALLQQSIIDMGFTSTIADPDVYRRRHVHDNNNEYWELLLVYVDDILIMSNKPKPHMDRLQSEYGFALSALGEPERYLGSNIEKVMIPGDDTGREYWSMSSSTYVKNAVNNVKQLLSEEDRFLKTTAKTPLPSGYRPELDTSDELPSELASRYSQLIGVLRWMVELGRIDVYYEVSLLSQYLALPRYGHLEAVYHIFAYLMKHEKSRIIFDPTEPSIDVNLFVEKDWSDFYGDVEEELPVKMPEPLGIPVNISVFVDANHAGNVVTRRSHTGILIYLQNTPVLWHSRRQNTVETSTFGSEFVALRTARDMVVAMRYKLRMFGIPIAGPAHVFCDNQGVVKNVSIPESVITKKHNAVNYHAVREAVAAHIMLVVKEDGATNLADLFTKCLAAPRRKELLACILYNF